MYKGCNGSVAMLLRLSVVSVFGDEHPQGKRQRVSQEDALLVGAKHSSVVNSLSWGGLPKVLMSDSTSLSSEGGHRRFD